MFVRRDYAEYETRAAILSQVRKIKKSITRRLKTTTISIRTAVHNERNRSPRKVLKHNRHIHSTERTTKRWLERRMGQLNQRLRLESRLKRVETTRHTMHDTRQHDTNTENCETNIHLEKY